MLRRCREPIEQHAPPGEKANPLAVTQVFSFYEKQLRGLVRSAGSCPDLEAFRNAVSSS
jgi:hypothetical protein